jgi:hypothetical protein
MPALLRALTVSTLLLMAACDRGPTAPTDPLAGTWTLVAVNGVAVPVTVFGGADGPFEIVSDVLTVANSGSFTRVTNRRTTVGGQVTTQVVTDEGSSIAGTSTATLLFYSDSTKHSGPLRGTSLSLFFGTAQYDYRRD